MAKSVFLFIVCGTLTGCWLSDSDFDLEKDKKLVVVTRMSGTTYYKDKEGMAKGYEHDLVEAFAKAHGLKVEFEVEDSVDEVFKAYNYGKGDLYAAGITKTTSRQQKFIFSDSYLTVQQQVVCRKRKNIKSPEDLTQLKLKVAAKSSYVETLKKIKEKVVNLSWDEVDETSSEHLLEELWENKKGCTIADSNIVKIHRRYFPELKVVYTFPQKENLAWIVENNNLAKAINEWLATPKAQKLREKIYSTYYGYIDNFDVYDTQKFIERIETRLPKYEKWIKQAAQKYDFNWKLLAAIAYQESQWMPKAKSPTGVRGFMMLTNATAKEVGVENRLDPQQSIMGGAKYLALIQQRIPNYVPIKERFWMALASYNVGYYHFRDAQALAILKEFNPNQWSGVRRALPLLSEPRYFKKMWYGYARGKEPVVYVDRIKNYYDILREVYGKARIRRPAEESI